MGHDLVLAETEQAGDILTVDHAAEYGRETFQTAFRPRAGIASGFSGVII